MPIIYKTADIGKIFGCGKNQAYGIMNTNGFPSFRIGKKLMVEKTALEKWLDKNKGKQGVHTLRHSCASLLFAKGADVKDVSELLGHSSTAITYNTYIHLIKEQHQKTVDLLND